jgi:capsular polysaccharide biosynthesis protein
MSITRLARAKPKHMALQEVARRVLLGHWVVILVLVLASAGAVTAFNLIQAPTYTASTRLVLDAPAPTSLTEATSIADAAKAIVTSPSHVIAALTTAGVVRDPVVVVRNITLAPLGTSGVLQLSVQDSNAVAASNIANALADDLIQTRLAVSAASQRAALDERIKTANDQIATIDQQVASLEDQLQNLRVDPSNPGPAAVQAQILADRITAYSNQRTSLTQQELQLEAERNSLSPSGSVSTPSVIDRASPPAHPDPSRLPVELALALVIGVIVGIGIASILETFGPTLSSGEVIADALGAPLLGWLPDSTGTLPDRLTLAASTAEVTAVEVLGVGETPNLSALAKSLHAPGQGDGKGLVIFSAEDAPSRYRNGTSSPSFGFVLVATERIRKTALTPVRDLVTFSGRPLVGVIVHSPARRPSRDSQKPVKTSPRFAVVRKDAADPISGMNSEVASDLWGTR